MENEINNLLKKYSADDFKTDTQSFMPPIYDLPLPDFKIDSMWGPGESPAEKFDTLLKFNKKISESLVKEQAEVKLLKLELKQIKESHKHDFLKNALIAFSSSAVGAIIGVILTLVITSKNG